MIEKIKDVWDRIVGESVFLLKTGEISEDLFSFDEDFFAVVVSEVVYRVSDA